MSAVSFINASVEKQQAVTSLLYALESGRATFGIEGSLLFDVLSGRGAEVVFDGVTSGRGDSIDATIWTDGPNLDPVEVATVRITVEVLR